MSNNFFLSHVLPVIFLICGLGLLTGAARYLIRTRRFLERARVTIGDVVAMLEEPPTDSGDSSTWRPVVSFSTTLGQSIKFESIAHSNPPEYSVGAKVPVLYDPREPNDARIRSFSSLWLLPIILGVLGLVFSTLGTGLLLGMIL